MFLRRLRLWWIGWQLAQYEDRIVEASLDLAAAKAREDDGGVMDLRWQIEAMKVIAGHLRRRAVALRFPHHTER